MFAHPHPTSIPAHVHTRTQPQPEGELTIFIDGVTTLDAVPEEMAFMIYAIDGGNAGGGPIGAGKGHYWDQNASLDLNHAPPPGFVRDEMNDDICFFILVFLSRVKIKENLVTVWCA